MPHAFSPLIQKSRLCSLMQPHRFCFGVWPGKPQSWKGLPLFSVRLSTSKYGSTSGPQSPGDKRHFFPTPRHTTNSKEWHLQIDKHKASWELQFPGLSHLYTYLWSPNLKHSEARVILRKLSSHSFDVNARFLLFSIRSILSGSLHRNKENLELTLGWSSL